MTSINMTIDEQLIGKKMEESTSILVQSIFLEELKNTMKYPNQYSRCPVRDSNRLRSE